MRLAIIRLVVTAALAAGGIPVSAVQGQEPPDPYTITAEQLGPVTVGMTTADAIKALGEGWSYRGMESDTDQTCGYITPEGPWSGLSPALMAQQGIVTRIEVNGTPIYTEKGIHVGSTEAQVIEAYGAEVQSEPHAYAGPPAKYLTVWFKNAPKADSMAEDRSARGLRFETNEQAVVIAIYAGDTSIQYIEGCA